MVDTGKKEVLGFGRRYQHWCWMNKLWLRRKCFLHPSIPSAREAHARVVRVAPHSFLGPGIALILGSVQLCHH